MVGKRQQFNDYGSFNATSHRPSHGQINGVSRAAASNGDVEHGPSDNDKQQANGNARPKPSLFRFRDAADTKVQDERREELKKALLSGIDRNELEKFRKSDDELKAIKNKKVRSSTKSKTTPE
ncbi:hypothetical protein MRB53_039357 [Persea americana]|nr:hypothetical protein MRB53_039357 [Persea americana]